MVLTGFRVMQVLQQRQSGAETEILLLEESDSISKQTWEKISCLWLDSLQARLAELKHRDRA